MIFPGPHHTALPPHHTRPITDGGAAPVVSVPDALPDTVYPIWRAGRPRRIPGIARRTGPKTVRPYLARSATGGHGTMAGAGGDGGRRADDDSVAADGRTHGSRRSETSPSLTD